jgi:short-subunit dehydrogenase
MDIAGSVTLITGASAGIGLATARRFAAEGARLALVARSADKLEAFATELRGQGREAIAIAADLRDPAAVKRMVEEAFRRFGRVDILINNAGQAASGTVAEVNPEHFRQILELNVWAPFHAIQAVVPMMRATGGGLIINVSSMVSKMQLPGLGTYAATKAALNLLSATARVELAESNIRVLTMYPRMTSTDFGKNSLGDQAMRQRQRSSAPRAVVVDTAEAVAEKILEAARKEPAEQYMEG